MNADGRRSEAKQFFASACICVHLWLFFCVLSAPAHPLPNMRFDRTVHVRLGPTAAEVRYTLELNDWTMVLDGKNLVSPADVQSNPTSGSYSRAYATKKAPHIADNLRAALDGVDLPFRVERFDIEPERDHMKLRLLFRAAWSPTLGKPHEFTFEDQNFEDRSGAVTLTLDRTGEGIELTDVVEPVGLRGKSPLELKPDEVPRLRRASAEFVLASRAAEPPGATATSEEDRAVEPPAPPSVFSGLANRGIAALFDTGYGLGVMLLLAFGFGAAHAFTPGHGKTLVAAYLVGERGTVRHALVLGLVTTAAHTGSVIAVAVILRAYYGDTVPATTEAALKVAGGLLIFGVGLWLFLQRIRGRADHVHLFSDHHHAEPTEARKTPFGWLRVVLLGLGGGIVPCWDAVLLLLVAASAGRLGIAVPLLLAFSAGLAAVLVGLGIGVVFAHRAGGRSFGDARWFQTLPMISAALLIGLGLWFTRDGAQTLLNPEAERSTAPRG